MLQRSFTVVYSKADSVFSARYPALANIPFILDSTPRLHRLGSAYLLDRGLGLWGPRQRTDDQSSLIPATKSINNYAAWLANFLEWAEKRNISLSTCSYAEHVQGRYQTEMLSGLWSRDRDGCSATTANLRVQQACDFLNWMVARKHRDSFSIPYETIHIKIGSATSSVGHLRKAVNVRQGKAPVPEKYLSLPIDEDVRVWLRSVRQEAGETSGLMCECILLTGMRREEIVCLRTNTLPPNRVDWKVANPLAPPSDQQVRVDILFGTKGRSFGVDHGDKIGPQRSILMPMSLAIKLDDYRNNLRNRAFSRRLKNVKGKAERIACAEGAVHLFLREDTGERFTGKRLYDDWCKSNAPMTKWNPHQGRHWWACSILWREIKKHDFMQRSAGAEMATALLENSALSIIRLQIQPQLGHVSDSTTMIYVRWVTDMFSIPAWLDDPFEPDNRETLR